MKLYRVIALLGIPLILLAHDTAAGARTNGKNLLLLGGIPASLGRGGTGVSSEGIDFFALNPASTARVERPGAGIRYGAIGGAYAYPSISSAFPTSYGVFGFAFDYISGTDDGDIEQGGRFSFGAARDLTERLTAGIALDGMYGKGDSHNASYLGAKAGLRYAAAFRTDFGNGFGIYDLNFGAAIHAGASVLGRADLSHLVAGYSLGMFRSGPYSVRFFNDYACIDGYSRYPAKFGLEAQFFTHFFARGGFITPSYAGYGDFTLGAGVQYDFGAVDARIDYALAHHPGFGFAHYCGMTFQFGEIDTQPPQAEIFASEKYISPNYDGRQDYLLFTTRVRDRGRIKGWRLQILNADRDIVREYRLSETGVSDRLTISALAARAFRKKESLVVPEAILWDGTDSRGRIVPDGSYSYSFMVWDERDNISSAKTGTLYVDTTPPAAELKADDLLFSPNGDRRKDTFVVEQKFSGSPDDKWNAAIVDANGVSIRHYAWTTREAPARFSWDGRDDAGNEVAEGLYSYSVECADSAGNIEKKTIGNISLTRHYEEADITCSMQYFSPTLHGETKFFLSLSNTRGLKEWRVILTDSNGKPVKEFSGTSEVPRIITWDGKNADGKPCIDGRYYYRFYTEFESGNIPSSFDKELVIDGTPPKIKCGFSPSLFSPDGDGENDTLTLYPVAGDDFGLKFWNVYIYSQAGELFKSFSGKSTPAPEIKWDGVNELNELVESAADYYIVIDAMDLAGNYAKSEKLKMPVDVLVLVTERGLKMRISNIEFAFNSAALTKKAFPVLDRVAEKLRKYSRYSVLVEGHTDDIGEEEYNLKLSEERSKSVMDYLIKSGIAKERLSFRGMGETTPFLPNTHDESRRKNRRVEFILIRENPHE